MVKKPQGSPNIDGTSCFLPGYPGSNVHVAFECGPSEEPAMRELQWNFYWTWIKMNEILARRFFFYVSTSTQVLDNFPATSTKFPTSTKVRHAEPFNQPTNKKTTAPLGGEPPWPTPGSHAFVRGICRGASDLGVAARAARRPSSVVSCRKVFIRGIFHVCQ